jgi:uncharacterized NAD(P)/FAD-binding protein YdhS
VIAIVGGGCSGVLLAAHVFERRKDVDVTIIEPKAELGRGVAYSTPWKEHLLNVPAGQMSPFSSRPSDLVEWLARNGHQSDSSAFLPRSLYGTYLRQALDQAIGGSSARFTHVRAEVVDVGCTATGVVLGLSDGRKLGASLAVLAHGNPSPAALPGIASQNADPRIFDAAWDADALRLTRPDERVLLIGSGLTAVDALVAFESQGHQGPLHLVSRRGQLPQGHTRNGRSKTLPAAVPPSSLREAYRRTRQEIRGGRDWRDVVDGLRPVTNGLWNAWTLEERSRFLRHVKAYWDSHRHRMAPEASATVARCRQRGRLFVHAGRIGRLSSTPSGLLVHLVTRQREPLDLEVDRVINCTGIAETYQRSRRPLIQSLIARKLAIPNEMGTGFATDAGGALVDASGRVSDRLFTLGPPRYGELMETIAVPEISTQAEQLAERLIESLGALEPMEVLEHDAE